MNRQETERKIYSDTHIKVYCINCKHFEQRFVIDSGPPDNKCSTNELCNAPDNFRDTYYAPKTEHIYMPKTRNYNNRCELFEKKEE